jgi:putative addiction module component (TIGR02574 family)
MPPLPVAPVAQRAHTLGMPLSDTDIGAMTIEQRLALIERLYASLPNDVVAPDDPEFEAEVARRMEAAKRDPASLLDGAEVLSRLRANLR